MQSGQPKDVWPWRVAHQAPSLVISRWPSVLGLVAMVMTMVSGGVFGCGPSERERASPAPYVPMGDLHPIETLGSPEGSGVSTSRTDALGRPVVVACSSCHAARAPDATRRDGAEFTVFHQGLTMRHGGLTCLSCHGGDGYDALRLADGSAVPFPEVMTLCRQCHGPQARDYAHGTHGGMAGYWDRSKGPRTRNSCVVCHDAHAPAYSGMQPAPGPADRFLDPPGGDGHD